MPTKQALTNAAVAALLGVSEAAVSRYKTGHRIPHISVQVEIERIFGWSVSAQAVAHSKGKWARGFKSALCRAADRVPDA